MPIQKKYVLVLGIVILSLISYHFALKKTVEAWQQYRRLNAQLNNPANLTMQPGYLIRKRKNLDSVLAMYLADTTAFRNNTLSRMAMIAEKENVKLNEVPPDDPLLHTNTFILQRLDFEGDFFSLTKVLNSLQAVNNIGLIRSVDYKAIKKGDPTNQKLSMEVYFEMVSQ
ncbi:MAG TPA: hypothetical protein VNW51_04715 [Mucilaginibacter sp.]|nr:hypothetical protein [Mucilaginibacter sp.]